MARTQPEDGLPDGQREPGVQEAEPPNQAARDCDRDIPPPLAQIEPKSRQPINGPPVPRRATRLRRPSGVLLRSRRPSLMRTCLAKMTE